MGLAEDEPLGDLGVRQPFSQQAQHLELAFCEVPKLPRSSGARGRTPDEVLDEPAGEQWVQQPVAGRDAPYGVHQVGAWRALEQKATGTGPKRLVDVLVQVERRQHQHARTGPAAGEQPTRRRQPIGVRHADVHEDDVWFQHQRLAHRCLAVRRLTDDQEIRLGLQHQAEPLAHHHLVVDEQDRRHRWPAWTQLVVLPVLAVEAPEVANGGAALITAGYVGSFLVTGVGWVLVGLRLRGDDGLSRGRVRLLLAGSVLMLAPLPTRWFVLALAVAVLATHDRAPAAVPGQVPTARGAREGG